MFAVDDVAQQVEEICGVGGLKRYPYYVCIGESSILCRHLPQKCYAEVNAQRPTKYLSSGEEVVLTYTRVEPFYQSAPGLGPGSH